MPSSALADSHTCHGACNPIRRLLRPRLLRVRRREKKYSLSGRKRYPTYPKRCPEGFPCTLYIHACILLRGEDGIKQDEDPGFLHRTPSGSTSLLAVRSPTDQQSRASY